MYELQSVTSSMLEAIGVDGADLIVQFRGGRKYRYRGAASHYDDAMQSESVGRYINGFIKPNFEATQEP